jgi:hypothetical protein
MAEITYRDGTKPLFIEFKKIKEESIRHEAA